MELADRASSLIDQLGAKLTEAEGAIASTREWFPDPGGLWNATVDMLWRDVQAKYQEVVDWFGEVVAQAGDPLDLFNIQARWRVEIGACATNLARDLDAGQLLADDYWAGIAANQYRQAITGQQEALRSIDSQITAPVSAALTAVAYAIIVFWGAVVNALVQLVRILVPLIAGLFSGAFTPESLAALSGALGAFLISAGVAATALGGAVLTADSLLASTSSGIQSWPAAIVG